MTRLRQSRIRRVTWACSSCLQMVASGAMCSSGCDRWFGTSIECPICTWLDKFCVFRGESNPGSSVEACRWRMPGNIKRAFRFAASILVLLNVLCWSSPLLEYRETSTPPVLGDSLDLWFFLPLCFLGARLQLRSERVHVFTSLAFYLDHYKVIWNNTLTGELRALRFHGYMRDVQAATICFEDFLETAQARMLHVEPLQVERGSRTRTRPTFISILTFKPPDVLCGSKVPAINHEAEKYCQLPQTFLSLLKYQDQLLALKCSTILTERDSDRMIGEWQVAIWHNVLARTADSLFSVSYGSCKTSTRTTTRLDTYRCHYPHYTIPMGPSTNNLGTKWPYVHAKPLQVALENVQRFYALERSILDLVN